MKLNKTDSALLNLLWMTIENQMEARGTCYRDDLINEMMLHIDTVYGLTKNHTDRVEYGISYFMLPYCTEERVIGLIKTYLGK